MEYTANVAYGAKSVGMLADEHQFLVINGHQNKCLTQDHSPDKQLAKARRRRQFSLSKPCDEAIEYLIKP